MSLNPKSLEGPIRLESTDFVVHRQRPSDNELDFDAVMISKEILREWSDSEWPEDDFSLEQNAQDLSAAKKIDATPWAFDAASVKVKP